MLDDRPVVQNYGVRCFINGARELKVSPAISVSLGRGKGLYIASTWFVAQNLGGIFAA